MNILVFASTAYYSSQENNRGTEKKAFFSNGFKSDGKCDYRENTPERESHLQEMFNPEQPKEE